MACVYASSCHATVPKASPNDELVQCDHKCTPRATAFGLSFTGLLGFGVGFRRCITPWARFGISMCAQGAKHFGYVFLCCT